MPHCRKRNEVPESVLGNGRSIPVPCTSIIDDEGQFKLEELSVDDLKRLQTEHEEKNFKGLC